MGSQTLVATCNVLSRLGAGDARDAVATLVAAGPDIVALQEWSWSRRRLLPRGDFAWVTPAYGGIPVGSRRDRYTIEGHRLRVLGWVAPVDLRARPVPALPPQVATVVRLRDLRLERTVSVVCYHRCPVCSRAAATAATDLDWSHDTRRRCAAPEP